MASRCGPMRGASQTIVNRETRSVRRGRDPLDRERQKAVGGRAPPLRIARREVHADVAVRKGAEEGVDKRMQHDIGVGMAGRRSAKRT